MSDEDPVFNRTLRALKSHPNARHDDDEDENGDEDDDEEGDDKDDDEEEEEKEPLQFLFEYFLSR